MMTFRILAVLFCVVSFGGSAKAEQSQTERKSAARAILVIRGSDTSYSAPFYSYEDTFRRVDRDAFFTFVGDGKRSPSYKEIVEAAKKTISLGLPTTIFLDGHGASDGKYGHYFDQHSTRSLFKDIQRHFPDTPVHVIVKTCMSGAAVRDVVHLPKGSVVVSIGSDSELAIESNYFFNGASLHKHEVALDAWGFLYLWLRDLQEFGLPWIGIHGDSGLVFQLDRELSLRRGAPFLEAELKQIKTNLSPFFSEGEIEMAIRTVEGDHFGASCSDPIFKPMCAAVVAAALPNAARPYQDEAPFQYDSDQIFQKMQITGKFLLNLVTMPFLHVATDPVLFLKHIVTTTALVAFLDVGLKPLYKRPNPLYYHQRQYG